MKFIGRKNKNKNMYGDDVLTCDPVCPGKSGALAVR
jgi:hypothetical protein